MPDDANEINLRWMGRSIRKDHWHFHRRLLHHYHIVLEPGEFAMMLRDIRSGRAPLIMDAGERASVYMILDRQLFERFFVLVRDGQIVTALRATRKLVEARRRLPG